MRPPGFSMKGGVRVKKCRIKAGFMAGVYIFNPRQESNFEDETAAALEEAGLLEIIGDVEPEDKAPEADKQPEPQPVAVEPSKPDYDKMDYNELKEHAKDAGIEGFHSMKKALLIEALKGAGE